MISKKLQAWRKKHGLSQSQAALKLGVPLRTLQRWEQGQNEPQGIGRTALEKLLQNGE